MKTLNTDMKAKEQGKKRPRSKPQPAPLARVRMAAHSAGRDVYEYFWSRERWEPATVELIEEWGTVLAHLQLAALGHEPVRPRRRAQTLERMIDKTTVERVRPSTEPQEEQTDWSEQVWDRFAQDVAFAAGLKGIHAVEDLGRFLIEEHGETELARTVLGVIKLLDPERGVIARHHLASLVEDPAPHVDALCEFVLDRSRNPDVRLNALDCLLFMKANPPGLAESLAGCGHRYGPSWLPGAVYGLLDEHSRSREVSGPPDVEIQDSQELPALSPH